MLDLRALAGLVADRYAAEFPDEPERYGEHWRAWCRHDNQYLLHWAVLDTHGMARLDGQVAWLSGVLGARGYPVERLVRDLELAAEVVEADGFAGADDVAARLRAATSAVG